MAYYTPGTRPDRQSRVALDSQNQSDLNGPLPLLSNGDMPIGQSTQDSRRPVALSRPPFRLALFEISGNAICPELVAPSAPVGQQSTVLPATRPRSLAADSLSIADSSEYWMLTDTVNPGAQSTALPVTRLRSVGLDNLTIADASEIWMLADATNAGAQQTELPPRAASRARDYSITAAFPLSLIGQDAMATGQQSVELPPRAALRARDYSYVQSVPLNLLGQDALVVGQQLSGNAPAGPRRAATLSDTGVNQTVVVNSATPVIPCGQSTALSELSPRPAARARDYSLALGLIPTLIGQDQVNPGQQLSGPAPTGSLRARDYSVTASFPLELIGQDSLTVGQQRLELAPPTAVRARDYSLTVSFPLELIGADAMVPGQQLSGPAPSGARRATTLSEPGVNLTLVISQAPPVIPCGLSTELSALPPKAAARARDYSVAAAFPLTLIGKDQLFAGAGEVPAYDWQNPRGAARLRDYSWIQGPMPVVPVGQNSAASELPTLAARRTYALYDPGANYTLLQPVVVAPLPYGAQATDLTPRAAPQAREYGQESSFPLELIGKDALPTGDSTASSELPPRGAARARDYSWLQSFPLYVFQQLPPGQSTGGSELSPKAPLRAKDYSHLQPLSLELYGQDQMYGRPGEVPAYDWQLPTPAAARMRDYSWTQTFPRGTGTPPRDLVWTIGAPQQSRWTIGAPRSKWTIGKPRE